MSTQIEEPKPFDTAAYLKQHNAAEAAHAAGKEVPKPAEAVVATTTEPAKTVDPNAEPGEGEHRRLPRSTVREMNRLREELGAERGRREMLERLIDAGKTPKQAESELKAAEKSDKKPVRADFATDAEFVEALATHTAGETIRKSDADRAAEARIQEQVEASNAQYREDMKLFPDWDEAVKAGDDLELDPKKDGNLIGMLATSKASALLAYHFFKNPDEWERIRELRGDFGAQKEAIDELTGQVKALYRSKKTENTKEEKKAEPTAAERDAKKPKPSEAVSARGGVATDGAPSMLLPDGKTLNPAWKAAQNAREGRRP